MASTAIPALQTLDIGSIQDLMTPPLYIHSLPWHQFTSAQTYMWAAILARSGFLGTTNPNQGGSWGG